MPAGALSGAVQFRDTLVIPRETGLREQVMCLFRLEAEPYRAAMFNVAAP